MQPLLFAALLSSSAPSQVTLRSLEIIEQGLTRAMLHTLTYPSSIRSGRPYQVAHCRGAPKGCEARLRAFARYFVQAAVRHDLDPWVLAAVAFRESGFNPFAEGVHGERGVFQIHPKNRQARALRWYRDDRYRESCRDEVGACQEQIVEAAAVLMERAIRNCGSVESGLTAYNKGVCSENSAYARRVLQTRQTLWARAGATDDA